jgi:hypothetical protein
VAIGFAGFLFSFSANLAESMMILVNDDLSFQTLMEAIVKKDRVNAQVSHDRAAVGVTEFCDAHGISRALFYILAREGKAPRMMRVRGRVLISAEAAREWRDQMERARA